MSRDQFVSGPAARRPGVRGGAQSELVDSVVEVIDPETGTLLGSLRVDAHATFISNDGFAASYREDERGMPFIDVWKFVLLPDPGAPDA